MRMPFLYLLSPHYFLLLASDGEEEERKLKPIKRKCGGEGRYDRVTAAKQTLQCQIFALALSSLTDIEELISGSDSSIDRSVHDLSWFQLQGTIPQTS